MTNEAREQEIWKTYPEFSFIEVSNLGRIRTKDRVVTRGNGRKYHVKGRVLKQQLYRNGYVYVSFGLEGKTVKLLVHRAVAASFLPNPDNLPEVNHIDCDRLNNRLDNLEYCTRQENNAYRDKLGHWVNNNPGHPVIAVDLNSFKVLWFESQREAARQLGIYVESINMVVKGRQNKAGSCWLCDADENAVGKARKKFGDEIARKVEELMKKR